MINHILYLGCVIIQDYLLLGHKSGEDVSVNKHPAGETEIPRPIPRRFERHKVSHMGSTGAESENRVSTEFHLFCFFIIHYTKCFAF